MRCQGCQKEGAVGRNVLPMPNGVVKSQTYTAYKPENRWGNDPFAGNLGKHVMPSFKYLCKDCIDGKKQPEKVEDEREYPF